MEKSDKYEEIKLNCGTLRFYRQSIVLVEQASSFWFQENINNPGFKKAICSLLEDTYELGKKEGRKNLRDEFNKLLFCTERLDKIK